jgi:hypothetical protein
MGGVEMTTPLVQLAQAKDIDDVLSNVAQIIDWASTEQSPIGYFAVVYQRVTLAVQKAINTPKKFEDPTLVADLDVAFAQRYFDALNGFFDPNAAGGLTLPWEIAFLGAKDEQAIILQHLLIAFNAHISFDLGMACCTVARNSLKALQGDFYRQRNSHRPDPRDRQCLTTALAGAALDPRHPARRAQCVQSNAGKHAERGLVLRNLHGQQSGRPGRTEASKTGGVGVCAQYLVPAGAGEILALPGARSRNRQTRKSRCDSQHGGTSKMKRCDHV